MNERLDRAISALKSELARANGDLTLFDPHLPLQELLNAGYTTNEARSALDEAEQSLGMWKDK